MFVSPKSINPAPASPEPRRSRLEGSGIVLGAKEV